MKRFAKIGGEMVSLTAVEDLASAVWPDGRHAVVAMPDSRKGEKLVLVTDRKDADVGPLAEWARSHGAPELAVPKKIIKVARCRSWAPARPTTSPSSSWSSSRPPEAA